MRYLLSLITAAVLTACGGGDPEPDHAHERVSPPQCAASGVCQ